MRLQWSEIRARAVKFAEDWKHASYEKGETHSFYNDFFECFGVSRRQVATYEQRVRNLPKGTQGFIDLFWPGVLIVEQKSAGLDLRKASGQALDYYDWLPEAQRPRYILTCDFQRWHLLDLEEGREWRFLLGDLKDHVEAFAFVLGVQPRLNRRQSPANVKASQLMGQLHEALAETGYGGHDLQLLLVRLLFILFADDTRIFNNKDQFFDLIERRTAADGSDLGRWLSDLFEVLNTDYPDRQSTLDADLAEFPYINGKLFEERIRMPAFDNAMRTILIDSCEFDWGEVSPAIFGSLFESVIDKVTQRKQGAHYTPEEAILKLIGPLFLDELHAELKRAIGLRSGRDDALGQLHDRIAGLTFLDPACGAGNFLVVAYRELRELERELIKERYLRAGMARREGADPSKLSRLNVDRFFGIEIDEFPARIAEVALWMTDHIANTRLGEDFGVSIPRIPLVAAPSIRYGDALEIDWNELLPAERCSYVLGNPPFVGAKYQSAEQRAQVRALAKLGGSGGTLDYVAAWFIKAGEYAGRPCPGEGRGPGAPEGAAVQRPGPRPSPGNASPRIAFVATNSITQGEQVAQLWPILFHRSRLEIAFAHRTFVWPGRAGVHCVIVGLARFGEDPAEKRLFSYVDGKGEAIETKHGALTAYLFDAKSADRHLVVKEESRPINGAPRIFSGSQPIEGGHYIFDATARAALLTKEPAAERYLRPYIGAEEFINGGMRWILALQEAAPADLRAMPLVRDRMRLVREFRARSQRGSTLAIADTPAAYNVTVIPDAPFLVLPEVSSERRDYIPIGWLEPPVIPSNKLRLLPKATLWHFGILTSRMHIAWLKDIGGRLESRLQYGIGIVYNTFPWPDATPAQQKKIEALAQAVLDARAMPKNATSSLADLYDPDTMPAELRKAHRELDLAVDKLYRARPFGSDRERVEHLFPLYEALVQPTSAAAKANRRTARRTARQDRP
ncbi:MAG TPA: DNA methyltransferase [Sphingomicrobium sp.]|nr:DNA methyltransferase [Sphingomicrobium sp.]